MVFLRAFCIHLKDNGKMVKCTLVQALRLCTGPTAHRGSRGISLLILDHGTKRGERSASRPGKDPVPILQDASQDNGEILKAGRHV